MGKSPGRWIKTVLFGKKHAKPNFSKNVTPEKMMAAAKTPAEEPFQDSPAISDPYPTPEGVDTLELERESSGPALDAIASSGSNRNLDAKSGSGSLVASDADMRSRDRAAAKAQAAFRGYLARRAFRALKGIVRLQALIRGHLVRRQAVSTLCCVKAIVRLQALIRGRKVDIGANSFLGSEKLSTNTFIRKLLVKMAAATPLSLQYDVSEPNSAWIWVERWSATHFWDPPLRAETITKPKPPSKQPGPQLSEPEPAKSKRTIRRAPTAANGENATSASEMDHKPKRNPVKLLMSSPTEQAQSELERVKRSLRKVSSSTSQVEALEKSKPDTEKPRGVEMAKVPPPTYVACVEMSKTPSPTYVPGVEMSKTPAPTYVPSVEMPKMPSPTYVAELETTIIPPDNNPSDLHAVVDKDDRALIKEPADAPHNTRPVIDTQPVENDVKIEGARNSEEKSDKDNQKIKKRRSSLPLKQQELAEKNSHNNSASLPSYMAATQSAKAKLRGQGSSKSAEDGTELANNNARRHSLPGSSNGKPSMFSPRVHNTVQANGKGGNKTNGATAPSNDDKTVQPGWRR